MHRPTHALANGPRALSSGGARSAGLRSSNAAADGEWLPRCRSPFPFRINGSGGDVRSDAFQASGPCAARLESEPDLAAGAWPASERELLVLEVGCGREAVAVARAALRQIKELGTARDDAILVASELVTNAVVHSGGSPADMIQVRAALVGRDVSISVHDPGLSGDTPHLRDTNVMQPGGHGLRIVKRLARRWGFELDRGRRVWAELATGDGQ
jgi:anti-sigma regulatory factor (Ser/Thr protein kinase)